MKQNYNKMAAKKKKPSIELVVKKKTCPLINIQALHKDEIAMIIFPL